MVKLVEMGNSKDIVTALKSELRKIGINYPDSIIIEGLEMMADGVCEIYIGVSRYDALSYDYTVSQSFVKGEVHSTKLFMIERGCGFDLIELPI